MNLPEAIDSLRSDLERYAASGKASPKAIAYRQLVLNTVIDGINALEEEMLKERRLAQERIDALRADLRQRNAVLHKLGHPASVDAEYWHLEGTAQRIMAHLAKRIDHGEGRVISTERAAKERKMLRELEDEFERLYDDAVALSMHAGRANRELEDLKQYCVMYGMDIEQFELLPASKRELLRPATSKPFPGRIRCMNALALMRWRNTAPAVRAMNDRRVADGTIGPCGIRMGHYAHPDDVVYGVLSMLQDVRDWEMIRARYPEAYATFCEREGRTPHLEQPWLEVSGVQTERDVKQTA